jgi:hypothetical protein
LFPERPTGKSLAPLNDIGNETHFKIFVAAFLTAESTAAVLSTALH